MRTEKQKITIYPLQKEFISGLKYLEANSNYEIVSIIAPLGFSMDGMDAGFIDNRSQTGFKVSSDFASAIDQSDAFLIANCKPDEKTKIRIFEYVDIAIQKHKDILCTLELDHDTENRIRRKCEQKEVRFTIIKGQKYDTDIYSGNNQIYNIDVPVVFVLSITESLNKFDIQITLRNDLMERGYKVSQVGSRSYCELFGFHSFPDFMSDSSFSEEIKIVLFNRFIKRIENKEKPDIIIIGIPGGSMPYNKVITNHFGVLMFLASQAVLPDYAILSVAYNDVLPRYFDMLDTSFQYRFGYHIDCFNMSNAQMNIASMDEFKRLEFNYLNYKLVSKLIAEKYSNLKKPVTNILDPEKEHEITKNLLNTLSEYSCTQKILYDREVN